LLIATRWVIHGFCVLSEVAQVEYKCTEVYDATSDFAVRWNDPELAVPWPIAEPMLSEKDARAPLLRDLRDRLIRF
jgi:dTDP-4-dehydrorhamnose 3,5-epimerase